MKLILEKPHAWLNEGLIRPSICHLRVFECDDVPRKSYIFVATEAEGINEGLSVTNGAEGLMTSLVKDFPEYVPENPQEILYYENYSANDSMPETLDKVTAKWESASKRFVEPVSWEQCLLKQTNTVEEFLKNAHTN